MKYTLDMEVVRVEQEGSLLETFKNMSLGAILDLMVLWKYL